MGKAHPLKQNIEKQSNGKKKNDPPEEEDRL